MNPTPEQVAQWAREAEAWATSQTDETYEWRLQRNERFATLVAAWQAEQDAKRVALFAVAVPGAMSIAENIRANAPKVKT